MNLEQIKTQVSHNEPQNLYYIFSGEFRLDLKVGGKGGGGWGAFCFCACIHLIAETAHKKIQNTKQKLITFIKFS